ncbi:MAG TPA: tRNA pseudouridine(38-40) synthase TruA [Thermoanaerobaculia bacterium]|nr:tRNA pseudouridine(38-40) synthase TruA [Thermoanaerobaculia bacterium]
MSERADSGRRRRLAPPADDPAAPTSYRLTVAYVGTRYAGWQRQPNALAVQQVLEEALAAVAGGAVRVVGAGRTDAGVHARGQVASLALGTPRPPQALVRGSNRFLPADVRVMAAERVPPGFDARRHADSKSYLYRFERAAVIDPFAAPFVVRLPGGVSLPTLRRAAALLPGRHDFSAFAKTGGAHRQPVRTLHRVDVLEGGSRVALRFVGDGFLRGMVRSLVGTLLEVARGRLEEARLRELLAGGARCEVGPNAPAHGLELEEVVYPERWAARERFPVETRTGAAPGPPAGALRESL